MHFLNACILKTDEKNALRFKNADFKNQMSDAIKEQILMQYKFYMNQTSFNP